MESPAADGTQRLMTLTPAGHLCDNTVTGYLPAGVMLPQPVTEVQASQQLARLEFKL